MIGVDYRGVFYRFQFILQDHTVIDYHIQPLNQQALRGDIYRGKLIDCQGEFCFVAIGNTRLFVRRRDMASTLNGADPQRGQTVYVQVVHSAYGDKLARATAKLELASEHLVLVTDRTGVHLSKKIKSDARRKQLLALLDTGQSDYGLVVRTAAAAIDDTILIGESRALISQWQQIVADGKTPLRRRAEQSLIERRAQHLDVLYNAEHDDTIACSQRRTTSIQRHVDVLHWLQQTLNRQVVTERGAELIIEELTAFTAVDINSANYRWPPGQTDAVVALNTHALNALVKQLDYRNISGTVLVDCLNMTTAERRSLREKLADEHADCQLQVKGFTASGILELTIPRHQASLWQVTMEANGAHMVVRAAFTIDYWLAYCLYYAQHSAQVQYYFYISETAYQQLLGVRQDVLTRLATHRITWYLYIDSTACQHMVQIAPLADTTADKATKTIDLKRFV